MYRAFGKRMFDVLISISALLLLAPFMLIIALLVRKKLGSPIIFKQQRPGKNEKIFTMYKFRTMTNEKGKDGILLPDDIRSTKFGKFLRFTSIDELPELFNVLKGDMSIVGPRPLLVSYLELYSSEQKQRHNVRPGITGWAQINGRNSITWGEKFKHDIWYVQSLNIILDIRIILVTFLKVIKKDNVNASENITMEPFKGES